MTGGEEARGKHGRHKLIKTANDHSLRRMESRRLGRGFRPVHTDVLPLGDAVLDCSIPPVAFPSLLLSSPLFSFVILTFPLSATRHTLRSSTDQRHRRRRLQVHAFILHPNPSTRQRNSPSIQCGAEVTQSRATCSGSCIGRVHLCNRIVVDPIVMTWHYRMSRG